MFCCIFLLAGGTGGQFCNLSSKHGNPHRHRTTLVSLQVSATYQVTKTIDFPVTLQQLVQARGGLPSKFRLHSIPRESRRIKSVKRRLHNELNKMHELNIGKCPNLLKWDRTGSSNSVQGELCKSCPLLLFHPIPNGSNEFPEAKAGHHGLLIARQSKLLP